MEMEDRDESEEDVEEVDGGEGLVIDPSMKPSSLYAFKIEVNWNFQRTKLVASSRIDTRLHMFDKRKIWEENSLGTDDSAMHV